MAYVRLRGHAARKANGEPYIYNRKQRADRERYTEALPRVLDYLKKGHSLHGASIVFGLEYESLRQRVKRVAPELIQPPRRRYIPRETKLAAVEDYLSGTSSAIRVGDHYGVSGKSILRWSEQYLCGELR